MNTRPQGKVKGVIHNRIFGWDNITENSYVQRGNRLHTLFPIHYETPTCSPTSSSEKVQNNHWRFSRYYASNKHDSPSCPPWASWCAVRSSLIWRGEGRGGQSGTHGGCRGPDERIRKMFNCYTENRNIIPCYASPNWKDLLNENGTETHVELRLVWRV